MNAFEIQKKFKILNTILAYLKSEHTFFHQGYDLVTDLDPLMKMIFSQVILSPPSTPSPPSQPSPSSPTNRKGAE
ncbi:hypothetical protein chiPu_0030695, partial [Chiloscyllium punctatum]|nr:hypothetical protein [Chiloscyllium punctatum]